MTVTSVPAEQPRVVIVGALTIDVFPDHTAAGGAVAYAARTAAAFGERAGILTVAAADADLAPLASHDVRVVGSGATLTFAHSHVDDRRELRLLSRPPRPLTFADLPTTWRRPEVLILAPLLDDDVDLSSFTAIEGAPHRALLAQGIHRYVEQSSLISMTPTPSDSLFQTFTNALSVFLSDEEVAGWPADAFERVARYVRRLVVTRGPAGADVYAGGRVTHVAAAPADVVDTTGAGDVFATAFILAAEAGDADAARLASAYAAACVALPGASPLPSREDVERRLRAAAGEGPVEEMAE